MKCSQKTQQTLEFDKILSLLSDCAATTGGKERALSLCASEDFSKICKEQINTSDAKKLIGIKGYPPMGGVCDIGDAVEKAVKGSSLSPIELLNISKVLSASRRLGDYYKSSGSTDASLDEYFSTLICDLPLENAITHAVIAEDIIADEASPALADIRRHIRQVNNKIKDELQKYTQTSSFSKYLQENIVTIRYGRYVIPVKAEYKNEVKGLVHDSSSSGATLFIEPLSIVEANNELRILTSKEEHEIERILAELSAKCAEKSEILLYDYRQISELDLIFAKAELSYRLNCTEAHFERGQTIDLKRARHPLLDKKTVVPIDISLGKDIDTLIITGPNTGGKTVSMKTLGLLMLMAQSGMHIPASDTSTLAVIGGIYTDIGDEQSIEQSLSTFSSHMNTIVGILKDVGRRELVLIDELGAGTDPVEGAALAISILEEIHKRGALCVATTHYAELKAYALENDRITNASCEFDVSTLRPTYRLITGIPGKSNAFAISEKLGLSPEIIKRASTLVSSENKDFENVLSKLETDRIEMERLKADAEKMKSECERECARRLSELEKEINSTKKETERMHSEAKRLVDGARASSEFVFKELDKIKKEKDKADFSQSLSKTKLLVRGEIRDADDKIDPIENIDLGDYKPSHKIALGDDVYVPSLGKEGKVEKVEDAKGIYHVRLGVLTTKLKDGEIVLTCDTEIPKSRQKKAENKPKNAPKKAPVAIGTVSRMAKAEIDLRGKNGEEAWYETDKYLDSAALAGLKSVTLIHGKGTGALRKAITEYLRHDPRVESFRLGVYGEGDGGVTIVELK